MKRFGRVSRKTRRISLHFQIDLGERRHKFENVLKQLKQRGAI